jgi:hypothetical protein
MDFEFFDYPSIVPINQSSRGLTVMSQLVHTTAALLLPPREFYSFVPLASIQICPTLVQPFLYFALVISAFSE